MGLGGHFHQVEPALAGHRQGCVGVDDPVLHSFLVDEAHLPDADLLVDALLGLGRWRSS